MGLARTAWWRIRHWVFSLPLGSQVVLASAGIAFLLIAAFLPAIQSTRAARSADEAQELADRARSQVGGVLELVVDLETGSRGFLITGDERFLDPWRRARRLLPRELESLERIAADSPETKSIASSIVRRAGSYLHRYSEPLVAGAREDLAGARKVVARGEGKRRVDALRAAKARLATDITRESDRRRSDQVAAERRALAFGVGGLALSLMLVTLSAAYLRRAIATPLKRLTCGARALASGRLDARVPREGAPEFAELAESFNEMAASLESSRGGLESANRELVQARQEAERADAAKSKFLSRMSHELRTPLNSILGFSQLLEMDDLTGNQRESVERVIKAGRHLLELINEVLDISRIEAGDMSVSLEPVDARTSISEAVELIRPLAWERGLRIEALPSEGRSYVVADKQRLMQILLNLLSNAAKYNTEAGAIRVTSERRDERLAITVADTGVGLTPAQIERLFVPFDRLGAESGEVEGTGLGLPLARRLTEAMGGTLAVSSEPGVGSAFTVELPLAEDPEGDVERRIGQLEPAPARAAAGERATTVLYIEDNPANMRLVERVLAARPGTELITAMQGGLGVELAKLHRPDLVLLDLHLPDMEGEEVLSQLKASPPTRSVPVIVVSADATERQIARLLEGGAHSYLTKPLDVSRFLETVAEVLDRRLAEDQRGRVA